MTGDHKRIGAALAASALINLLFLISISLVLQGALPDVPWIHRTSSLRVGLLPPVMREVRLPSETPETRNVAAPVVDAQKTALDTEKTERMPAPEPLSQASEKAEIPPESALTASMGDSKPVGDTVLSADSAVTGAAAPQNSVQDLRSRFLIYLQNEIAARREYPRRAQKRGTEGTVVLFLQVLADGTLKSYKVERSSGSSSLDRAAANLIVSIFPASRAPGRDISCSVAVEYRLN